MGSGARLALSQMSYNPMLDRRFIEWPVRFLFVLHNSNLRLASERTRAKLSCATIPQAVVCLMRPILTLFPLLIWRCFCRANRGGHPTETRTPISTLKGWPPSQLEDGTLCDFSVSRSVGLPVSGLKSVQSFGLA